MSPPPFFEPQWSAWDDLKRPVWLFDPVNLRGIYANKAALILWGAQSREELLARDFSGLSEAVTARTQRLALATGRGEEVSERWTFYPNGSPVTVQALISGYRLFDGSPVLLFEASPVDAEPEERRSLVALRHSTTMISLFDEDGRPLFANPAVFAAYGAYGMPLEQRLAEPEHAQRLLAAALRGETCNTLIEAVTRQGRRWHRMDIRPSLDPVTGACVALLQEYDVTSEVQAHAAQADAERKAAAAEERRELLSRISHELRTPLNAMLGFSQLLSGSGLDAAQTEQVAHIHSASESLLTAVNTLITLAEGADEPASEASPSAPIAVAVDTKDLSALKVLYVDDNAANRLLVTSILASQGIACQTADDGSQGLEACRNSDWDLVLMDIQMPVMDGVRATRAIRALPNGRGAMPIVALTANTLAEQRQEYAAAGMNDCMAKPIDVMTLIGVVSAWTSTAQPTIAA